MSEAIMGGQNSADLQAWVGRTTETEDVVTQRLVESFQATLSPHLARVSGDPMPLGLHWCLAPDIAAGHALSLDGHPANGGFLPPIPLPRRMWAAGSLTFTDRIALGDRIRRRSTIAAIEQKQGRSGPLVFVTVRHAFSNAVGSVLLEDQTIVYREQSKQAASSVAPVEPLTASDGYAVDVDPVLLFRYSALTFNGHRIHYDFPYATEVEHYPGLVIHGPLQATLLLNLAAKTGGRTPARFSFRGTAPATGAQRLMLHSAGQPDGGLALTVTAADGTVTMTAVAEW